jgi:hypothetical protein
MYYKDNAKHTQTRHVLCSGIYPGVVRVSALIWCNRYIYYLHLQFLIIIID